MVFGGAVGALRLLALALCVSSVLSFQCGGLGLGSHGLARSHGRSEKVSQLALRGLGIRRGSASASGGSTAGLKMMDPNVLNFGIGAISGTCANLLVYPLDLSKTKMQNAKGQEKVMYSSIHRTMVEVTKKDGIAGLWRGSQAVMVGSAPESAIQLASHDWIIGMMAAMTASGGEVSLPLSLQVAAGCVAGASTILATNPMEVLRIRAATGGSNDLVQNIKDLGPAGLFRGYQATWLRDIPFSAIYFPLFINTKVWALQHLPETMGAHDTAASLIAGFCAGMVASLMTTPMDVLKTRVQSSAPPTERDISQDQLSLGAKVAYYGGERPLSSLQQTALQLLSREGFGALWKGVDARVYRLAPCMAITLVLYEGLKGVLGPLLEVGSEAASTPAAFDQAAGVTAFVTEVAQQTSAIL